MSVLAGLLVAAGVAVAGPTYTFSTSVGTQPSNVGIITITQVDLDSVNVLVDLIDTADPAPKYGFINTGGPHTPFAFNISGSEAGVSATFIQPAGGSYSFGLFSLGLGGGDNTPYGTYGVAIDSTAGNGSGKAYYGDLEFELTRLGGLSTDDFVANLDGYYFSADLTNGDNTGAQAWNERGGGGANGNGNGGGANGNGNGNGVPEPSMLALVGLGLLGAAVARRRKSV